MTRRWSSARWLTVGLTTAAMAMAGLAVLAPPATADPAKAFVRGLETVTVAKPTSPFKIQVPELTGAYTLTWSAGDDLGGSSNGTLDAQGHTADLLFDPTGFPDGSRALSGTITVVDPIFGEYASIPFSKTVTVDRTPIEVTLASATRTKLYPRIARGEYPSTTTISLSTTEADTYPNVVLRSGSGKEFKLSPDGVGDDVTDYFWDANSWLGNSNQPPAPAGAYTLVVKDPYGNETITDLVISVSNLHTVRKTWKRTFSARRTLVDRYVGRCSTLKMPSARGWAGSIGYYANTRCGAQTGRASAVAGIHAVVVPKAYKYGVVYVHAHGGAATARPSSTAMLGVIDTEGEVMGSVRMRQRVGNYKTRVVHRAVQSDRSLGWIVRAAFRERYDVKTFTVELYYDVLVP